MIKVLLLAGCVILLAGCTSPRVSQFDEYEKVKVDKMVGNDVKFHFLSKTIVCLNGMREARWPAPVTNTVISFKTNVVVASMTNITVSSSANQQLSSNTNLAPSAPVLALVNAADPGFNGETNSVVVAPPPAADSSTEGVVLSTTRNESLAVSPNQSVLSRTTQKVTMLNNQGTVNGTNYSVTGGTNQVITVETNLVISTVTNQLVTSVTNQVVTGPTGPVYDYYLYTEIAPADFPLASGESLVVLIDGERHAFTAAQPVSVHDSRRGFLTTFYRVTPDVLAGIANAREAKIRIRNATGGLERRLSAVCRQQFREFLHDHFEHQKPKTSASLAKHD